MSVEECIHGLGDPAWCTICNGRQSREEARERQVVARWAARYTGRIGCGHDIEAGDWLARLGDGRIVCEDCAP